MAIVEPEGIFYTHVTVEDVPDIVASLRGGQPVERLFYRDPVSGQAVPYHKDIKFYSMQQRIILRNIGRINPERIEDYVAVGGYQALKKVLTEMTPEQVIDVIKRSGLRGRGGAGFPTGQKWEFCRSAPGDQKYMICNADEGDPGAFMDRSTMEGDPNTVLEGMAIAAYAIGASEGYVYIRAEYPLAVKRVRIAIKQAEEKGFLGDNIMGSSFSFHIHVKEGAGAFRLRRRDGPDGLHRGQARYAPLPPALPGHLGPLGQAQQYQQRQVPGDGARHHQPRRGLVRRHRHRKEQGHLRLRPHRQDRQQRPHRGADGHPAPQDHLRDRRRHSGRQEVQGRPDGRAFRRLPARVQPRYAPSTTSRWRRPAR